MKVSHGIFFCLSNSLIQVYFKDHTEMFVNTRTKIVTYIDREKELVCISYKDAMAMPYDCELSKRLKYTKKIAKQLINTNLKTN